MGPPRQRRLLLRRSSEMRKIFLALFLTIAVATVGHSFPIVSYVQISTGGTQAGGFNTQLGTVGSLTVTDLNANRCVQTGPGGTLAVSDNQCGNGGVLTSSAILVITQNQVAVSSPALNLNILSPPLLVSLTGSATGTLTVDPSSVTLLGNIFQSTNVWKGGNTYQSSMTVNGLTSFNNSVQFKNVEAQFFNGAGENSVQILNPGAAGTHLLQLNAAGGGLGINQTPVTGRDLTLASIAVNGLTTGQCVQVGTGGLLTTTGAGCIAGSASSGHINASTQAYIPYYSTPGSTNTLSGSPGISVTTFTTTGAGPGQIALREGDRQNVKNVGLGAFVIWNDLATHTAMFNSAGGSSQTLVGVSGVTTNGHMAVMNGSNIVDYGDFPSMPRYELQPATITPHLDAGLQGTFATLTSTISLPYIVKTTYNNISSMTATGTYFDLSGSTMANVLIKTPTNIYQGISGSNTSEVDFTNVFNNSNSSLAQRWYAGTGFNYPLILGTQSSSDSTQKAQLWLDPTNGTTMFVSTSSVNAFSISTNSITGTHLIDISTNTAITFRAGSGVPPNSQALCLSGGQLGHCTSVVGAGGGCTCSAP